MVNYWLIRAGAKGSFWDIWKDEKLISIGWDIGDIKNLEKEEIQNRV